MNTKIGDLVVVLSGCCLPPPAIFIFIFGEYGTFGGGGLHPELTTASERRRD